MKKILHKFKEDKTKAVLKLTVLLGGLAILISSLIVGITYFSKEKDQDLARVQENSIQRFV